MPSDATEALASVPDTDELDPELLRLPDPPRGERRSTLVVMALAALASAAMAVALTHDAAYSLRASSATDLGELAVAPASSFADNSFVLGRGRLGGAGQLRYERPFENDSYRIAPIAGNPKIWVEVRVPAGQETNRFVPKTSFTGRLVRFSHAGLRHRGLRSAIAERTGQRVPDDAYLLVDGQSPSASRAFALLWAMFVAFALWNAATIVKLVRKVK